MPRSIGGERKIMDTHDCTLLIVYKYMHTSFSICCYIHDTIMFYNLMESQIFFPLALGHYHTWWIMLSVLKGERHFVALQMKLTCPPIPVESREEFCLYTHLLHEGPAKPTLRNWNNWAKAFQQHDGGIHMFP
jgi:hypothetical protein